MAKKRKLKKGMILILGIILFFGVYFAAFKYGRSLDEKNTQPVKTEEDQEDTRSLMSQLSSKEKIYISDSNVENVRIEESYWTNVKILFSEFSKIRTPDSYTPVYSGNSDDGIRFSTDLNYFRVYTVSSEEYYKVPVATKRELEKLLGESIYLSFDFVKKYKNWDTVEISYEGETKEIHKWKFDDLAYNMGSKRIVGKVQPQKNQERSKYNFTINIKGKQYNAKLETMGKDYVRISQGEGNSKVEAYYEVLTGLYDYLVVEVFQLEQSE